MVKAIPAIQGPWTVKVKGVVNGKVFIEGTASGREALGTATLKAPYKPIEQKEVSGMVFGRTNSSLVRGFVKGSTDTFITGCPRYQTIVDLYLPSEKT
jgi:hypothetical protein